MGYAEYLNEEYNYDENLMTDDENSDLIGGYKSDESSIEGEDEVTVIVCDEIKIPEEEKCNDVRILKILS